MSVATEFSTSNLRRNKCISMCFRGYYLKNMSIQFVLMHRTGMWKIKWKSPDFVVFSGILLETHQSSMSLCHGKGMRNWSKIKCILSCFPEYYWKIISIILELMHRKGMWKIKRKSAYFEVFSGIFFEKNQYSMFSVLKYIK